MTDNSFIFQIQLMRKEAAKALASRPKIRSDYAYLLELLAFEFLLKAFAKINSSDPAKSHKYQNIFKKIPENKKDQLITRAKSIRPTADFNDIESVLKVLGENFVGIRYQYEKYEDLDIDEYIERGENWLQNGADPQTADFVYYSQELNGLISALSESIDAWLSGNTD